MPVILGNDPAGLAVASRLDFEFSCPNCDREFDVDDGVVQMMLREGCVVCETSVTRDAFRLLRGR